MVGCPVNCVTPLVLQLRGHIQESRVTISHAIGRNGTEGRAHTMCIEGTQGAAGRDQLGRHCGLGWAWAGRDQLGGHRGLGWVSLGPGLVPLTSHMPSAPQVVRTQSQASQSSWFWNMGCTQAILSPKCC